MPGRSLMEPPCPSLGKVYDTREESFSRGACQKGMNRCDQCLYMWEWAQRRMETKLQTACQQWGTGGVCLGHRWQFQSSAGLRGILRLCAGDESWGRVDSRGVLAQTLATCHL